jgi:hypothetical protein
LYLIVYNRLGNTPFQRNTVNATVLSYDNKKLNNNVYVGFVFINVL